MAQVNRSRTAIGGRCRGLRTGGMEAWDRSPRQRIPFDERDVRPGVSHYL